MLNKTLLFFFAISTSSVACAMQEDALAVWEIHVERTEKNSQISKEQLIEDIRKAYNNNPLLSTSVGALQFKSIFLVAFKGFSREDAVQRLQPYPWFDAKDLMPARKVRLQNSTNAQ